MSIGNEVLQALNVKAIAAEVRKGSNLHTARVEAALLALRHGVTVTFEFNCFSYEARPDLLVDTVVAVEPDGGRIE